MASRFNLASLVPPELMTDSVAQGGDTVGTACGKHPAAACPACGTPSRRVHSRYVRQASSRYAPAERYVCFGGRRRER